MKRFYRFLEIDVSLEIPTEFETLIQGFRRDFGEFERPASPGGTPDLEISVRKLPDGQSPKSLFLFPWFRSKMCRTFGWGSVRRCDYGSGLILELTRSSGQGDRITLWTPEAIGDLAREVLFTATLSLVSENLELRGYQRIHGLAFSHQAPGGESRAQTVVLALPSGAGKSVLALLAAHRGDLVLSDESPFIKQDLVYPFPLRLGLRDSVAEAFSPEVKSVGMEVGVLMRQRFGSKRLFNLRHASWARVPSRIDWIGMPKSPKSPKSKDSGPLARPLRGISAMFGLTGICLLGIGLTQMKEFMIVPGNLPRLTRIFWGRLKLWRRLSFRIPVYGLPWDTDARQNFELLESVFSSNK